MADYTSTHSGAAVDAAISKAAKLPSMGAGDALKRLRAKSDGSVFEFDTPSIPAGTSIIVLQATAPVGYTKKADWAANASVIVGNNYAAPAGTDNPISWETAIAVAAHSTHTHTGPSHTHTGPSHTHSVTGIVGATGGSLEWRLGSETTGASGTQATGPSGTANTGPGGPTTHTVTQDTYTPIYTVAICVIKV